MDVGQASPKKGCSLQVSAFLKNLTLKITVIKDHSGYDITDISSQIYVHLKSRIQKIRIHVISSKGFTSVGKSLGIKNRQRGLSSNSKMMSVFS